MSTTNLHDFVCDRFAREAGIPWAGIGAADLSLAGISARSDKLHNSLDLMDRVEELEDAWMELVGC